MSSRTPGLACPKSQVISTPLGFARPNLVSKPQHARPRTVYAPAAGADAATEALVPLGLDFLTFLASTVLVIPVFKYLKISPVLGFLFSGVVLQQLG